MNKMNNSRLLTSAIIASSMLCSVSPSFGVSIDSVATGAFNDTATWAGGTIPGAGDTANLREHTVTLGTGVAQGDLDTLAPTRSTSSFVMESGSSLTVTNAVSVNWGNVTINGGTLDHTGTTAFWVGKSAVSSFIMNGGSVATAALVILGAGSSNANVILSIDGGATFSTTAQLSFGGNNGTAYVDAFVTDGGLTIDNVNATGSYAAATTTVNGGDFTLTGAAATSFGTPSAGFSVVYDSGNIAWSAVSNQSEFDSFQTTFNGWVDDPSGFMTSNVFSDTELKNLLNFQSGTGAVLGAVPEPSSFALLSGFIALGAIMLRRR